jgi:hypothetical protein
VGANLLEAPQKHPTTLHVPLTEENCNIFRISWPTSIHLKISLKKLYFGFINLLEIGIEQYM